MSIRIRRVGEHLVALCAAKTVEQPDDLYLDDEAHHALAVKFDLDFASEGRCESVYAGTPEGAVVAAQEAPQ